MFESITSSLNQCLDTISEKASSIKDEVSETAASAIEAVSEKAAEIKDAVTEQASNIFETAGEIKTAVSEAAVEIKNEVTSTVENVSIFNSSNTGEAADNYQPELVQTNAVNSDAKPQVPETKEAQTQNLQKELKTVEDNQGWLGNAWNGVKELTGIGSSAEKCEQTIAKFNNGEISYEEAKQEIDDFSLKQNESVNIVSNVASGLAAVGGAVLAGTVIAASGGTATPVVLALVGASTGAVAKAGIKFTDRATNNIDNDALNGKQILKDGLSGAVDGAFSAATMGIGTAGKLAGTTLKETLIQNTVSGAKAGAIAGAGTGSGDYAIEAALEDDVDFKIEDFAKSTVSNAAAGALAGGVLSGAVSGIMRGKPSVTDLSTEEVPHKLIKDVKDPKLANKEIKSLEKDSKKLSSMQKDEPHSTVENTAVKADLHTDETKKISLIDFVSKKDGELALSAKKLNEIFEKNINEATAQINEAFRNLNSRAKISGRAKSEESTLKKLSRKYWDDKLQSSDPVSCMQEIGDGYGTRLQLRRLSPKESKSIITEALKGYKVNYSDFCAFVQGNNSGMNAEKKAILSDIQDTVLDILKERQSQEFVDNLVNAIKNKELFVTELNNYGDNISSYFTKKQVEQIAEACREAENLNIKIVNRQELGNANGFKKGDASIGEYEFNVDTKKAVKDSGYTSAQMNITHFFKDKTKGYGEFQVRGTSVNKLADVEHIPYDIRQDKITFQDKKYRDIYKIIKKMEPSTFDKYNRFLTRTYHSKRLSELGIPTKSPDIRDVFRPGEIPSHAYDLLSVEGLIKISQRH